MADRYSIPAPLRSITELSWARRKLMPSSPKPVLVISFPLSASSNYIPCSPGWSATVKSLSPIFTWPGGSSRTLLLASGRSCRSVRLISITLSNYSCGTVSAATATPSMPSNWRWHS